MLVKNSMTRHPILVGPTMSAADAQQMMVANGIHHLPIADNGKKLVGLVTQERLQISPDRLGSLDVWEISRTLSNLTVGQVMLKGKDLATISPDATVEDAAALMLERSVDGLPVVEDDVVIGIITQVDLMVELQNLLGANEPGWRITVRVPDERGEFAKLTSAILEKDGSITSMGSVRTPKTSDSWDVIFKVRPATENTTLTQEALTEAINGIPEQELIDIRETTVYTS